jgi:dipeptidyl aminopeptidase/acylaminoacyl peptidase
VLRGAVRGFLYGLIGLVAAFAPAVAWAQAPIDPFIAQPAVLAAALSPSGEHVAVIQRSGDRQQIIVLTLATRRALIAQETDVDRGVFDWVAWKGDERILIGATAFLERRTIIASRVVSMNREGEQVVVLVENRLGEYGYGSAFLLDALPHDPNDVLLTVWSSFGSVVRADVRTGRVRPDTATGAAWALYFATDGAGYPVLRGDLDETGDSLRIYRRASGASDWTFAFDTRRNSITSNTPDFSVVGPGPGASQLYVLARPPETDLTQLYLYDSSSGSLGAPIQMSRAADVAAPWIDPATREILATCEHAERLVCEGRDPNVNVGIQDVLRQFDGNAALALLDVSRGGQRWLLRAEGPQSPGAYFVYDRPSSTLMPIVQEFPGVDATALTPTRVVQFTSRDGAPLWGYLTSNEAPGAKPLVVVPHGGPEARDLYGYDPLVQFLASRGYAVFQPNFRGSSGFGRAFADAGRRQWGQRMQDDVTDGVRHLIGAGVAEEGRVCIVGASYGGYAALAGAAFTPELYRCAVSISGVSDLEQILRAQRREGRRGVSYQYWSNSIGDLTDEAALDAISPRRHAAQIRAPVLLVHGGDDDIVSVEQSESMAEAMRSAGGNVRFVRVRNEGHSWPLWREQNRRTLFGEIDGFLAQHLGAPTRP